MSDENKGYRYENPYLTEEEHYDIDYEFRHMLFRYRNYLYPSMEFLIGENIALYNTGLGVLTLFVKEKNKKGITKFNYNFIK